MECIECGVLWELPYLSYLQPPQVLEPRTLLQHILGLSRIRRLLGLPILDPPLLIPSRTEHPQQANAKSAAPGRTIDFAETNL